MDWSAMKFLAVALSVVTAAILCYRDKEGWGWFLFIAFAAAMSNGGAA